MTTECILIPLEEHLWVSGLPHYRVTNVGKPYFWPHDGDVISENDIPWLTEHKGWKVTIALGDY